MGAGYDSFSRNMAVDIGDLQVDFLGSSTFPSPQAVRESPLHLHTKHEFQYVLSGTLEECIDEEVTMRIEGGQGLLIPPNILHRNLPAQGQRIVFTIAMQQIATDPPETDFSEFRYYCELFGKLSTPVILSDDAITYCVNRLVAMEDTPQNVHERKSLLSLLFIRLAACAKSHCRTEGEGPVSSSAEHRNHQYFVIEQFINTRYNQKVSVSELAKMLYVSRRQADRIIVEIFGETYASLALKRRMSIARTLLRKTDLPCSVIAEKVGYSSYTGFFVAFKQYFHMTPDNMRKQP